VLATETGASGDLFVEIFAHAKILAENFVGGNKPGAIPV
jgi:hypothetical protein